MLSQFEKDKEKALDDAKRKSGSSDEAAPVEHEFDFKEHFGILFRDKARVRAKKELLALEVIQAYDAYSHFLVSVWNRIPAGEGHDKMMAELMPERDRLSQKHETAKLKLKMVEQEETVLLEEIQALMVIMNAVSLSEEQEHHASSSNSNSSHHHNKGGWNRKGRK